jgi:t-SNARE complex subunit (syntaxin)
VSIIVTLPLYHYLLALSFSLLIRFLSFVNTTLTSQTIIDNIELNISSVAVDTQEASQQLTTAAEYQRKAGRRAACLLLILAIVAGVVLLAVSFRQAWYF